MYFADHSRGIQFFPQVSEISPITLLMERGFLIPCHSTSTPWFWLVDAAVVNECHYEQLVLKPWGELAN